VTWRIKSKVNGKDHIYPEGFDAQYQAEDFLKTKLPAAIIPGLIADGTIKIFKESVILNADGSPIEIESGRE